jgi:pilus assembly protein CpaE
MRVVRYDEAGTGTGNKRQEEVGERNLRLMTLDKHMNVVAILRSDEAGQALNAACTDMNGTEVATHVGRLLDVQGDVDLLQGADVLILDVDPRSDEEMGHLRQVLQHEFPGTPIVVTAADASLQDVRQFMHLGVVDFVPQPITQADLKTALKHAGGGVGASTLAVQSACLLASRKKTDKSKVCLIDLDLQFGTDALYLDLDNRVGVADLLETPDRVDLELLHSVMGHHPSGLELLAAPREVVTIDSLHATDLERCLKLMRAEYGTIFLDLPSAWTPWSYAAVRNSDLVILVIQLRSRSRSTASKRAGAKASPSRTPKRRWDESSITLSPTITPRSTTPSIRAWRSRLSRKNPRSSRACKK